MTNDSPHLTRLVQRAPLDLLRELVTNESAALGGAVPWERDPKEVRAALKTAVLDLPRAERHALDRLSERIDRMADEAGSRRSTTSTRDHRCRGVRDDPRPVCPQSLALPA